MVGGFEWSLDIEKHYPWLLLTKCNTTLSISISVTSLSVCLLWCCFPLLFPFFCFLNSCNLSASLLGAFSRVLICNLKCLFMAGLLLGTNSFFHTILSANSGLFLFLSKINQQQSLLQYVYGSLPKFLRRCLVDSLFYYYPHSRPVSKVNATMLSVISKRTFVTLNNSSNKLRRISDKYRDHFNPMS
jgi:hypothetical protein